MDVNEIETVKETPGIPKKTIEGKWYAIYTRPRAEKLVNQRLLEEGVETFLPMQKTYRKWSDRKKLIEKPLLPSYLFVKTKVKNFHHVYRIQGIVKFVSFEGKPVSMIGHGLSGAFGPPSPSNRDKAPGSTHANASWCSWPTTDVSAAVTVLFLAVIVVLWLLRFLVYRTTDVTPWARPVLWGITLPWTSDACRSVASPGWIGGRISECR